MELLRLRELCDINLAHSSDAISYFLRGVELYLWGLEILENRISSLLCECFLCLRINKLFFHWKFFLVPIWYNYLKKIKDFWKAYYYNIWVLMLSQKSMILYFKIFNWSCLKSIFSTVPLKMSSVTCIRDFSELSLFKCFECSWDNNLFFVHMF